MRSRCPPQVVSSATTRAARSRLGLAALFAFAGACGGQEQPATAGPGAGGGGHATTGATSGSGGSGGDEPALSPWTAAIEVCEGLADEDGDGAIDEGCAPRLFAGIFPPAGGADLSGAMITQTIEGDAGRPLRVVQTYRGTSPAGVAKIEADLAAIADHGAIPHLNLEPLGYSPAQYQSAGTDTAVAADLADAADAIVAFLAADPSRRLFLTFAAEMNGDWTPWGCLPKTTYVAFYRKAHDILTAALDAAIIDRRRVRFVYGPNNVSSSGCGSAIDYYPGHDVVDFVGMSSYREGTATVQTTVIDPAEDLLNGLGYAEAWRPGRFVLLQTGTRDEPGDDSGAFLTELHTALRDHSAFAGVIYFQDADWTLLTSAGPVEGYDDYVGALAALPREDDGLEEMFNPFFWDVGRADPRYPEIQSLRKAMVTGGCAVSPPRFCPDEALERGDAAVLLFRAFGLTAGASQYDDLEPDTAIAEATSALGEVLPGCDDQAFCPHDPIRRADLARALAVLLGSPGATREESLFVDLSPEEDALIAPLAHVGHVAGCADGLFCPEDVTTRREGAASITRAASIPPDE